MKAPKLYIIGVIILSVWTFSCTDDRPENLIPEDKYIDLFTELTVLNQLRDEQIEGISREYLRDQIFEQHGLSQETFRTSHNYYQRNAEEQIVRLEKVIKKLEDERQLIQAHIDSLEDNSGTDEAIEIELDELQNQEADSL